MRAKFGRDPMAGSKKVTLKFIIGYSKNCTLYKDVKTPKKLNIYLRVFMGKP